MGATGIIYGLLDPRDGALRYVGKTEGPLHVRLNHHVHRALQQRTNEHKANWIKSLVRAGVRPEISALEVIPISELTEAEEWHIQYWRALGADLTNATAGGEGASGHRHSQETRKKLSEMQRGKPGRRRGTGVVFPAEIVEAYRAGKSLAQIAEAASLCREGAKKVLVRQGVTIRSPHEQLHVMGIRPGPKSPPITSEMLAAYEAGANLGVIGKMCGRTDRAVAYTFKRNGIILRTSSKQREVTVRLRKGA